MLSPGRSQPVSVAANGEKWKRENVEKWETSHSSGAGCHNVVDAPGEMGDSFEQKFWMTCAFAFAIMGWDSIRE